ncbi:MAG TPA: rod shape-determining protein MreC [Nitrospiraceae bacterium]|nr:MAG: rod shape-determining protein MreC [Nitrospirae bacterium GWD2_57_8]HAR44729.1 rod shape-determining protein MreC [Nitrospiraceae bacterium]HAS54692.1 rod shape-determining protein MreC [Nitrospiraceae bacterium]
MFSFIGRNKKIFLALTLVVFLFWLVTTQVENGRFRFLERPVLAISGFFERITSGTYASLESAWDRYVFLVGTHRENLRLQDDLDRIHLENQLLQEVLQENERLRQLIAFRKEAFPSSVAVRILGRQVSPASTTITISKGSENGVQMDMPVIVASGVVGRVQTTLDGSAKVMLLTDPGHALAVRVQRNREDGLLEGRISHCALKYVSYYVDIQEGDLLVTSGLDGIYPKGLPVATVVKVTRHESNPFQTVVAKPVVRISQIEEALVLTK